MDLIVKNKSNAITKISKKKRKLKLDTLTKQNNPQKLNKVTH